MITIKATTSAQLTRILVVALLTVTLGGPLAYAEDCFNLLPLDLNSTNNRFDLDGTDTEMFEVDVTDRGILTLSALAPLNAPADLKLGIFDTSCRPVAVTEGSTLIKRFTSEIVLHVETPGTYRFGVALQDPSDSLDAYKVAVNFVDEPTLCASWCMTARTVHEVEPDPDLYKTVHEVEPDPDLFTACLAKTVHEVEPDPDLYTSCFAKTVHEVEPDPDLYKTVHEVEPDPDLLQVTLSTLGPLNTDDHADQFFFATPLTLGQKLTANLGGLRGESDVFTFSLTTQATVRVDVLTVEGLRMGLYDQNGQKLETVMEKTDLTIIKSLVTGSYYIRVEGSVTTDQPFNISVKVLGW